MNKTNAPSALEERADTLWQNFDDTDFWVLYEQLLDEAKPKRQQIAVAVASVATKLPQQITSDIDFKGDFRYTFFIPEVRKKKLLNNYQRKTTKDNMLMAILAGLPLAILALPFSFEVAIILLLSCLGRYLWLSQQAIGKQKSKLEFFMALTPEEMTVAGRKVPLYNITRIFWNDEGFQLYKDIQVPGSAGKDIKYVQVAAVPKEIDDYDKLKFFFEVKAEEHRKYIGLSKADRRYYAQKPGKKIKKKKVAQSVISTKPRKPTKQKKPTQPKPIKQKNGVPKSQRNGSVKRKHGHSKKKRRR